MKRSRRRRYLLILAAVLLVPALALSLLGVKLLRDTSGIANSIRMEYAEYAGRIAARSLEEALWEGEQLNMVAARLSPPEDPDAVVRFLNRFQKDNPLYRLAFFVVPEGLTIYSDPDPAGPGTTRYRPLPEWILGPIRASLVRNASIPSGLSHIAAPDGEPVAQVTYFTLHARGELLGVAGFLWDLESVRRDRTFLDRVMIDGLGANRDLFRAVFFQAPVAFSLLDETGRSFYSSTPEATPDYILTTPLGRVLPFYSVGVQLTDDRFDAWLRTLIWTNLAAIAVMLGVILVGLAISVRFVLHEMELAELKSTLVSNVSHELKTPLSLIRLFSETLLMGRAGDPAKTEEFLRIIHKESDRLTHLINNVLDVGRIEQGRKTYELRPTDLRRVIEETVEAYRYRAEKEGVRMETRLQESLPPVPADPEAMTQALINLMDNAIKYSPEEKYLRVELSRRNGELVIDVEDHGIGISGEEQDRIFETFYRVEKGLVHTVKGSGLGLPLVQHIVEAHGGRVTVSSRVGSGSTFSIHLPLEGTDGARKEDRG